MARNRTVCAQLIHATVHIRAGALAEQPVVHIASHGVMRSDNPLWSSIELADGLLYAHDLERSGGAAPFVVLSGCDTGVGVRAGTELVGLSATLLDHGTRSLIASVCPLPDAVATSDAMAALHRATVGGVTPSAALAALPTDLTEDGPALAAACLTCFGVE